MLYLLPGSTMFEEQLGELQVCFRPKCVFLKLVVTSMVVSVFRCCFAVKMDKITNIYFAKIVCFSVCIC